MVAGITLARSSRAATARSASARAAAAWSRPAFQRSSHPRYLLSCSASGALLIPGAGEAQRLVPGRKLDRPRARVATQGHSERLEHDPRDVVLRLRLGQPERVHLHPVAHPQELRVGDAVALAPDRLPDLAH